MISLCWFLYLSICVLILKCEGSVLLPSLMNFKFYGKRGVLQNIWVMRDLNSI